MPIDDFETRYVLGVDAMDDTHREFVHLANLLGSGDLQAIIEQAAVKA